MAPNQINSKKKTPKQLERYFKGVSNHHRVEILQLIAKRQGITLGDIAEILECNFKTISEHTRKLVQSGLVNKKYRGLQVEHNLSPYGEKFLEFMASF